MVDAVCGVIVETAVVVIYFVCNPGVVYGDEGFDVLFWIVKKHFLWFSIFFNFCIVMYSTFSTDGMSLSITCLHTSFKRAWNPCLSSLCISFSFRNCIKTYWNMEILYKNNIGNVKKGKK